MAEFVSSDFYIDRLLTAISIAYKNPLYIADLIFPIVPVDKQTGFIPQYIQSDWFRNQAHLRATGSVSRRGAFRTDTATYAAHRRSFGVEIPDEVRDSAIGEPYNLERDSAEFATDKVMMERELSFVTSAFGTGIWAADEVGGVNFTQWDNYGASQPLIDMTTFADNIEARIGREPNTLVMGKQVWNQLKWHPDLIDLVKYTQRGTLSEELVANMLGITRLLIGRGIYTTSPEGTAEASVVYTRIWGKNALLVYTPDRPSLMTPASGYTFTWARVPNSISYIKRMRDEQREIDIIEASSYYQHKVIVARAAEFMSAVVA